MMKCHWVLVLNMASWSQLEREGMYVRMNVCGGIARGGHISQSWRVYARASPFWSHSSLRSAQLYGTSSRSAGLPLTSWKWG